MISIKLMPSKLTKIKLMNLYLVVLGGKINGGNVEMHDVRWVAGETIQSTVSQLKSEWVGSPTGLHIDSYKLIKFIDGYRIKLVSQDQIIGQIVNKLWFINLGGYKENEMLEQHQLKLVVAPSTKIAKQNLAKEWDKSISNVHTDDINTILSLKNYSVVLEADSKNRSDELKPDWSGYWVIG